MKNSVFKRFLDSVNEKIKRYHHSSNINEQFKKYLKKRQTLVIILSLAIFGLSFLFLGSKSLALIFFVATVLSLVPTMAFPMIGSEIGLTSAIILGSIFGWKTGFIVGTFGNIIGRVVTFDVDLDFLYDFFLLFVAIIASLFPLESLVTVGPILIVIYCVGALFFWFFIGAIDPMDFLVAITATAINIFVLVKAVPILLSLGFG